MRNLFFSLFATTVLYSVNAHALPIENADAFVAGDGKAIYEKSSGLTWLDFGINTDMTLYGVTTQLDSEPYAGWRLPTEAEVLHLFKALLPEFSVPDTLPPKAYDPAASTLLVRDTPITVPEPGLMALFLLGFCIILSQRFSSGKSSQR
ncbi:MAG TPA: hypothetical protein VLC79_16960 [Cellvibrio sp.]|nr:hypothetical protein [Cellvibrio sp.]